jgi:hypothetical protein
LAAVEALVRRGVPAGPQRKTTGFGRSVYKPKFCPGPGVVYAPGFGQYFGHLLKTLLLRKAPRRGGGLGGLMVKKRRDCGLLAVEAGARNRPAGTEGRRQAWSVYEPNLCAWPGAVLAEGQVQSFGHL